MVPGAAVVIGRARERAEALDDPVTRDAHRDNGAGLHEFHEGLVEGLALVLLVVGGEKSALGLEESQVDELVSLRLDSAKDLAGQVASDTVGLDEYEGFFDGHALFSLDCAANHAALFRSSCCPLNRQKRKMPTKTVPTTNMSDTRMPVATSASWASAPTR